MALCHGDTSHAVHTGGIAAGTGFSCNTSRWAQTSCCPAPSPHPSSQPSSCPPLTHYSTLKAKQREMHCSYFEDDNDVGVVITSVFREMRRCGKRKCLGVSRHFASR